MRKRKNNIWIAEPLIYAILVAGFGLLTTFVNHINQEKQPEETKFMSLKMEDNIAQLMLLEKNWVSL